MVSYWEDKWADFKDHDWQLIGEIMLIIFTVIGTIAIGAYLGGLLIPNIAPKEGFNNFLGGIIGFAVGLGSWLAYWDYDSWRQANKNQLVSDNKSRSEQ